MTLCDLVTSRISDRTIKDQHNLANREPRPTYVDPSVIRDSEEKLEGERHSSPRPPVAYEEKATQSGPKTSNASKQSSPLLRKEDVEAGRKARGRITRNKFY